MTAKTFLCRFLKENGIYSQLMKEFKTNDRFDFNYRRALLSWNFSTNGLNSLFYEMFKYHSSFSGMYNTAKRQKFYRLNRKWKNFIKGKIFLQHNISEGDTIKSKSIFFSKSRFKVLSIKNGYVFYKYDNSDSIFSRNILLIDNVDEKELVKNIFYKDEKGFCYGKIDGCYNEIQLQ